MSDRIRNRDIWDKIDVHGRQDERSEIEMIWTYAEEMRRHFSEKMGETSYKRYEERQS